MESWSLVRATTCGDAQGEQLFATAEFQATESIGNQVLEKTVATMTWS